jgi:hypothetical protein
VGIKERKLALNVPTISILIDVLVSQDDADQVVAVLPDKAVKLLFGACARRLMPQEKP